jgi:putative FmdB family regulatory protein
MPIYEYRCENCHRQFEELQKVDDPILVHCEACGKDCLIKLVSAAGFQLKGAGWYVTDFKDSGKKPESPKATENKDDKSTAETKGAETKPAESKSETPSSKKADDSGSSK